jgi:hypothetical protein
VTITIPRAVVEEEEVLDEGLEGEEGDEEAGEGDEESGEDASEDTESAEESGE